MITLKEAMEANRFHYAPECAIHTGPRGGVSHHVEVWRRNGATQRWKRKPEQFSIPVKFGLRSYGRIDNFNAYEFHASDECPIAELRGI